MSFTFTKTHHEAAHKEHVHPSHGHYNEYPALATKPQQDVDAVKQRTKIHRIIDKRAQPWRELVMANLHNHDVTTLPSLGASKKDVMEFLFFALGCDRYGSVVEKKQQETVQFIQRFDRGGKGLRRFLTKEDWLEDVPLTWTSVYNKTYEISDSTRKEIAKHCYHAITPLVKAERKAMEIEGKETKPKTRLIEKLKLALCFGKKAKSCGKQKSCETPPPAYVEKEKFSFEYEG